MSSHAAKLKKLLKTTIRDMAQNAKQFTKSPERDFTRNRKLDFASVISVLLSMSGGSTASSLMDYFKFAPLTASASAFVQQRAKLKPEAMEYLFRRFVQESPAKETFHGYRLLAVDGSDLQIFADPNDKKSYYPGANGQHPYSLLHLNALYDPENRIYIDALVQKSREWNEHKALIGMIDRAIFLNTILLADRGYESYNVIAHLQEKGWNYLIRIRDGLRSIVAGLDLPDDDEFDFPVELCLTRRQTKEIKALCSANPNQYRWLPSHVTFDYLSRTNHRHDPLTVYKISFRIVRFRLSESSFETVVTNLLAETFPPEALKQLYAKRWGIETSFRQLKYTLGLVQFHAKKVEHIFQEIFAKLIIYNFTELITSHVVIQKHSTKYSYSVNFSAAVHICRNFFLGNVSPPNLKALLSRLLLPVRPGRSNSRKPVQRPSFSFLYRVA
ncbi:MAG: IS4 family transposase [bacterium]|nr:IS4 family transposase [bacterium]